MNTFYYLVDESFVERGANVHCNIGGALVQSHELVELEVTLESTIRTVANDENFPYSSDEFKSSAFFPNAADAAKFKVAKALAQVFASRDISFLVSHAYARISNLAPFIQAFGSALRAIQHLAQFNVPHYLASVTEDNIVQIVADLGLSEAFRPTYEVYAGTARSIPMLKAHGVSDESISQPNWRRLPRALFLDSRDSRVLQFSDLVIGLSLAEQLGTLSPFKRSLLDCLEPIKANLKINSVEWNPNDA